MLNDDRQAPLSVIDASGRQISLLNDTSGEPYSPQSSCSDELTTWSGPSTANFNETYSPPSSFDSKRKYHCSEPGCNKSFTTSGHLSRHHKIHTGEKNTPCLFPGCQSRFSRQDNMMQHYRTHMSPKSRRTIKKPSEESHPRPRLHAHHRIRSDPYQLDPPLTIDQHLDNYHQSLTSPSKHLVYHQTSISSPPHSSPPSTPLKSQSPQFYQHRPLVYPNSNNINSDSSDSSHASFTLLHPLPATPDSSKKDHNKNPKQDSLLQLAHIVSTFG